MAKAKKKNTKKAKKTDVGTWTLRMILGDLVSSTFFSRNKFYIVIIVLLIMFYITIKYACQVRMETINRLETELAIVKTEGLREQGLYMSRTRESMMQNLVDSMNLGLKVQQQPPYRLKYDEK